MRSTATRLLELSTLPHEGPIRWTGRLLKGGHGCIRVNRLLDSPDVPAEALEWLLWHEYLHLHLKDGHTKSFRELERRWPGCVEAERFLDTLNQRFGVQAW